MNAEHAETRGDRGADSTAGPRSGPAGWAESGRRMNTDSIAGVHPPPRSRPRASLCDAVESEYSVNRNTPCPLILCGAVRSELGDLSDLRVDRRESGFPADHGYRQTFCLVSGATRPATADVFITRNMRAMRASRLMAATGTAAGRDVSSSQNPYAASA